MYDIIGDIHGYHDQLVALLKKLDYENSKGFYSHPERKALFLGDYIDRGPKVRETLELVRKMTDNGSAIALMGNHEYNALCFHFQESEGGHLRKHTIKNVVQHFETMRQFQNRQTEYESYVDWFKSLPLFFETKSFRAVHACWDKHHIDLLRKTLVNDRLTDELIHQSVKKGTPLCKAVNDTIKGKELKLPTGIHFTDKDGENRTEIRIKWWHDPLKSTYREISILDLDLLPGTHVDASKLTDKWFYHASERPVFFGHYWLKGDPFLYRENICCLDYSVTKGGSLAAYRMDDESKLSEGKFVWV